MSLRRLPRQMGVWIICNGTSSDPHPEAEFKSCPEKRFTANIRADINRQAAAADGWGRGLRKNRKRADHCPTCMPKERAIETKRVADRAADRFNRDELKRAKLKAAPAPSSPSPKKSRKSRSANPSHSPSADTAPAPAT